MFRRRLLLILGLVLAWGVSPSASAGTMVLDSFVDQSPVTIDPAVPDILMATVNTSGGQGGNDASATTVSIGGSIAAADVASVCVDYGGVQVACQNNPASLTSISISLGGNQKGGSAFDYRVTLNPSAAGKTIQMTVEGITNANLTDNIPLPQSTALRAIAGGVPPTVTSPTFASVTDSTATLGGNVTDPGSAAVTDRGIEWGTTPGGPWPNSVASGTGGTGIFTVPVTSLPSSSTIYFRAWATNGGTGYSAESSFDTNAAAAPPTIDTPTSTSITENTAILGGTVSATGGAAVTERGVVWNTTSPAESGGTSLPMGSGLGDFSQLVSSLPAGTLIYFKAYATNTAGTSYSSESSFTTLVGLPTVDTPTVTGIAVTSATLGGTVSSNGGGIVTDHGTVWGTSPNPTGNILSQGSGTGTFSHLRTGLPTATLVYFRAYATNATGTAYSADATLTPSGPPEVTSPTVSSITHNSAILGGTVTNDGGNPILGRGTVWNTTGTPVVENALAQGGITTGVFSHTRSLPAGTTIFYRAYATSSVGTGYSAEDSFTTASEPTVQATNITFRKVSGRSLRIRWTRGNGDGSIVVLRLAVTAKTDPSDGVDYAANPDYTLAPELPVNSQNFVVYKGTGSEVLVTGLTLSTNYSVAVYEYAGTGASTDYLTLVPAEASQATTNVPVHNEDNRVNCSDCHSHGSWFARDVELKDVCTQCHNQSGTAAAKLEFDNHLAPSKNPAVDFVDCGLCHELHTPGGSNTTESQHSLDLITRVNKSFLRANVDKYVSTSSPPAYLHTDQPLREDPHPDAPQDALTPDRAVEGGDDTTARGFCQVCHTLTNNHRSTNTAGSDQSHDGITNTSGWGTETNCGTCHQHNNKFIGVGGTTTCVACHDSQQGDLPRPIITTQFDRLSSHITGGSGVATQEDCLVCHDQSSHQAQTVRLWDADTGAASFAQPDAGLPTTDPEQGAAFEQHCLSCHDDGSADSLPASGSDQTASSPFTGSGAPPIIDEVAWASAAHNRTAGPAPFVSCLGGCHGSGHGSEQNTLLAPAVGPAVSATDFCFNCHDADGPSSIDVFAQFNVANEEIDGSGGTAGYVTVNKRHDVLPADQTYSTATVNCKDCHAPHAVNNSQPVLNPDTDAPLGTYSPANAYSGDSAAFNYDSGTDFDPTNPVGATGGPYTEPDYVEFCLTCHDGTAPPNVVMPGTMINIAQSYSTTDQHGNKVGNGSASRGYLKVPWVTQAEYDAELQPTNGYAAMNCTLCHGAHGSGNIYNLRTSITVAGQVMNVGGKDVFTTDSGPTYVLPDGGSGQEKFGWAAWCTFCHEPSHATKSGLGCNSAHMHGTNNF